jgi:hypothetical protein
LDLNIENICSDEQMDLQYYYTSQQSLYATLTSSNFNEYVESVVSGIGNTKEEIISTFNKANYLLSLV